jgi:hypothetical protein
MEKYLVQTRLNSIDREAWKDICTCHGLEQLSEVLRILFTSRTNPADTVKIEVLDRKPEAVCG